MKVTFTSDLCKVAEKPGKMVYMERTTTKKLAKQLHRACDVSELDYDGFDRDVTHDEAAKSSSFTVALNYDLGEVPARKVWRITVELVEDSTIDD